MRKLFTVLLTALAFTAFGQFTKPQLYTKIDAMSTYQVGYMKSLTDSIVKSMQLQLVSGTSIKTVNGTSLLGSGDVAVQATLVSGTNIKTVESTSLLGSGNVDITASNVGLGNVDNTADVDKPVSTAAQTALDLKASITYADGKVAQTITNGITTSAPSQDAVFDADATKQPLDSDLTTVAAIGSALQQLRINSGGTAIEYFTPSAGAVTSVVGQTGAITAEQIREGTSAVYNILDNGCVGDGTTDNSTAMAALITAAPAGSIIWVPYTTGGGFNFVTGLVVAKELHFRGEAGAKFLTSSNITILQFQSGADNWTVDGIWFDGSDTGASQRGIRSTACLMERLSNCRFTDFNLHGVSMEYVPSSPYKNQLLTSNVITSCAGIGLRVSGQYLVSSSNIIYANGTGISNENENNKYVGGSSTANTTGITSGYGKLTILGMSINHNSGSGFVFTGATQPISVYANVLANANTIDGCKFVDLSGAFSSLTINNQTSSSLVTVHNSYLTGGLTLSSGNAVGSQIWFQDNQWEQTGPSFSVAGSATIYQANNIQGDGTIVKIPRASIEDTYADISLTNAQFVLLRATPITIVAAPGAGYMVEFIKAELAFDWTANYTETADNLEFRWGSGGAAASETIECTGFVDGGADVMIQALQSASVVRAKAVVDNAALVLQNTGDGEFGGGNASNVMRVRIHYRIVSLGW